MLPPPHRPTAGPSSVFLVLVILAWIMIALFFFAPRGSYAALGIAIGLFVFHATWLRNAWREVPPAFRYAAPGKPVDPEAMLPLLLIPVYNIYCIYTWHVGLCEVVDATLAAYGVPRRAKRGLAVAACTTVACGPFIPFGLILLAAHMRSMDHAIDALREHTYRGWPARTPEPPLSSFVKWAWPTVTAGVVVGWVGAPYAFVAMRGISRTVAPPRDATQFIHPHELAGKLAEGVMRCRAQRGELPPSSTVHVPNELRRLGYGYTPSREEWLADPTFACADFAPTKKTNHRVAWIRESAQVGKVVVEDYRGAPTAGVQVSCGEDRCIGRGSPNGWTVHDPTPRKPSSGAASTSAPADPSTAATASVLPRTGNAHLETILAYRASRLEELRGVERLADDVHTKLSFPDGQTTLHSPPPELVRSALEKASTDPHQKILLHGSNVLRWDGKNVSFGKVGGPPTWTRPLAVRAAAVDPIATGDGFVFVVENGGVQRWRVGRSAPERRLDDACAMEGSTIAVSNGGRLLVANDQGKACLLDRETGAALATLAPSGSGLHAFSMFGRTPFVAAASTQGGLHLWDVSTGAARPTVSARSSAVSSGAATYATWNDSVATIASDKVIVYDLPATSIHTSVDVRKARAVALWARTLAILDDAGDVWITEKPETPRVKRSCGPGANRVALSSDGHFLMCGKDHLDHAFAQRTPE